MFLGFICNISLRYCLMLLLYPPTYLFYVQMLCFVYLISLCFLASLLFMVLHLSHKFTFCFCGSILMLYFMKFFTLCRKTVSLMLEEMGLMKFCMFGHMDHPISRLELISGSSSLTLGTGSEIHLFFPECFPKPLSIKITIDCFFSQRIQLLPLLFSLPLHEPRWLN